MKRKIKIVDWEDIKREILKSDPDIEIYLWEFELEYELLYIKKHLIENDLDTSPNITIDEAVTLINKNSNRVLNKDEILELHELLLIINEILDGYPNSYWYYKPKEHIDIALKLLVKLLENSENMIGEYDA